MFRGCTKLKSVDLSNIEWRERPTKIRSMFDSCEALTSVNLSSMITKHEKNGKVYYTTSLERMFYSCKSLTDLDLSNFDTTGVTDMSHTFAYTPALKKLNISTWDTSNCQYMDGFLLGSGLENVDLSHFDVSTVSNMQSMFAQSKLKVIDLSNWNMRSVKGRTSINMTSMFNGCTELKTIYVTPDFKCDFNSATVFTNSTKIVGGNGTTYNSSNVTGQYLAAYEKGATGVGYATKVGEALRKPLPVKAAEVKEIKFNEENRNYYNWDFVNNRYKSTKLIFDSSNVNITQNYDSSTADKSKERNIKLDTKNMEIEFGDIDKVATTSIGIFVDEPETAIIEDLTQYNFRYSLNDRFKADANGDGDEFDGYQFYRKGDMYVLGREWVEVEFDVSANGSSFKPKSQYIYDKASRAEISAPEGIIDNMYDTEDLTCLGFIGKDATEQIEYVYNTSTYRQDEGAYVNGYRLLNAYNYDTFRINANEAVNRKIVFKSVYGYKSSASEPYKYRTCGTPVTENCKHEGMIGNHAAITSVDEDYLPTLVVSVDSFEKLLTVLPLKSSELNVIDESEMSGYCYPRFWLENDITIPKGFGGIFSEGMTIFLNGHTINYEEDEVAIFDMTNSRKRETRVGKRFYSLFENMSVNSDIVKEEKTNYTYTRLQTGTDFNKNIKYIISGDDVTSYNFNDVYIKRILWTDENHKII